VPLRKNEEGLIKKRDRGEKEKDSNLVQKNNPGSVPEDSGIKEENLGKGGEVWGLCGETENHHKRGEKRQ